MKPNKESIVNDILIELEKGNNYSKTETVICGKYRFNQRTFDKYWKIGNERYSERQKTIQSKLDDQSIKAAQERLKKAHISRDESLAMLSNAAKLLYSKITKEKEYPSPNDIAGLNSTITNIAKLEGWNAPIKQAQTDSKGNDVKPIDLSKYMTFEQIMEALEDAENIHE